jgi:hypothetical protein
MYITKPDYAVYATIHFVRFTWQQKLPTLVTTNMFNLFYSVKKHTVFYGTHYEKETKTAQD